MKLNLITLATVKTQLGLADTTYDSAITAMIPIVSADIRRIMNYEYSVYADASIESGNTEFDSTIDFNMGDVVYSDVVADDTYISGFGEITGIYELSAAPSDDGTYIIKTINISMWPTISKMIWYRISKMNTTSVGERTLASKSIGTISLSFANSEINKQWNYPQLLINDLGVPYAHVG